MILALWAWIMGLAEEPKCTEQISKRNKDRFVDNVLGKPRLILNSRQCLNGFNSMNNSFYDHYPIEDDDDDYYNKKTDKQANWKKILFKKQGVPDNYVPQSFLQDLRKNIHLEKHELLDVIVSSAVLTKQIASISMFISMFVFFDTSLRSEEYLPVLFFGTFLCTMSLYLCSVFVLPKTNMYLEIKRISIFLVTGFTMSPILRTLTETISTDTIYFMVFIMMLVHFLLYNYGINVAIVSRPISLNAAFFASVCLASRLNTSYHVFLFLTLSIDIFVLFGIFYRAIPSNTVKNILSISLSVISMTMLYFTFQPIYCFLYFLLLIFVNLICPIGFYKMQIYKENIYGPWDEAIIDRTKVFHSPVQTPTNPLRSGSL